jgi:hypothetical protein
MEREKERDGEGEREWDREVERCQVGEKGTKIKKKCA